MASLEMALNISATMRNLSKLNRICTIYELCKHQSVSGRIAHAQTRPGQLDRLQPASGERCTIQKRLVIRIWKRSVDNTNSYASCASIFTDKFGDDPHGFGKKVTGKCFLPQNAFERSLVDWDMDGPYTCMQHMILSAQRLQRTSTAYACWCRDRRNARAHTTFNILNISRTRCVSS
jgi:hypothetical protein